MGFSRQENWSGLPCPPAGDLPNPGIETASLTSPALTGGFFTTSATWEATISERRRIDAFELWCWRRLLRVPWTARRSNQSILKEISPGISLEGMMLRLKLQYCGHLMQRVDSLEKTLMLGGIGGRRRGWQRMRRLDGITTRWTWVSVNSRSLWWTGRPGVLRFMGWQRVGHDWVTELNWTDSNLGFCNLAEFAY